MFPINARREFLRLDEELSAVRRLPDGKYQWWFKGGEPGCTPVSIVTARRSRARFIVGAVAEMAGSATPLISVVEDRKIANQYHREALLTLERTELRASGPDGRVKDGSPMAAIRAKVKEWCDANVGIYRQRAVESHKADMPRKGEYACPHCGASHDKPVRPLASTPPARREPLSPASQPSAPVTTAADVTRQIREQQAAREKPESQMTREDMTRSVRPPLPDGDLPDIDEDDGPDVYRPNESATDDGFSFPEGM